MCNGTATESNDALGHDRPDDSGSIAIGECGFSCVAFPICTLRWEQSAFDGHAM
jgi:hypothetical protein